MNKILTMSDWEVRVAEVFSMIRSCRMTSAAMNAYVKDKVWSESSRKHGRRSVYSTYVQGFVQGLVRARSNDLYHDHLEFCYVGADGVLYSTHRQSTHRSTEEFYVAGRGHVLPTLPHGHFWKGTDKPFFMSGETTPFMGSTLEAQASTVSEEA
jgi:hypothetical protein